MIGSWTTAYGWGDHSLAGYLTQSTNFGAEDGQILKWDTGLSSWQPANESTGFSNGEALILRDADGNMRIKIDPVNGTLEMFDSDEELWYSIEVSSPPTNTVYHSNGSYTTTSNNKESTYSSNGDLLKEKSSSNYNDPTLGDISNETTTYYKDGERLSQTEKSTYYDNGTIETEKNTTYNSSGDVATEETIKKGFSSILNSSYEINTKKVFDNDGNEKNKVEKEIRNGKLVSEIVWENGEKVSEKLYDDTKTRNNFFDGGDEPFVQVDQYSAEVQFVYTNDGSSSTWNQHETGIDFSGSGNDNTFQITSGDDGSFSVGVSSDNSTDPFMGFFPDKMVALPSSKEVSL
jgi:hypothetical protein